MPNLLETIDNFRNLREKKLTHLCYVLDGISEFMAIINTSPNRFRCILSKQVMGDLFWEHLDAWPLRPMEFNLHLHIACGRPSPTTAYCSINSLQCLIAIISHILTHALMNV